METQQFFSELTERLNTARREERLRYEAFFNELKPRLETAEKLERELNRHLAHRFNVLDYLRTDELGLSRIIADLLNPGASHGQGPLFLLVLLEKLNLKGSWSGAQPAGASVSPERVITAQRRIDVYVRIPGHDESYCLAIENKPYADDQDNQIRDYLDHLAREFGEHFVLIYLSPTGKAPLPSSLPKEDLDQWTGRFIIMGYHDHNGTRETNNEDDTLDPHEALRASFSLTDWLSICHDKCQVERLRWFLRDALTFCQREFGVHHMATARETRALEDFLLSNPDNLAVARAVYESWPTVRDHVCKRFLKHLGGCIERGVKQEISDFAHDVEIKCQYDGEKSEATWLRLYRKSWERYGTDSLHSEGRTYIFLRAERGVTGWYLGVGSPLSAKEMTEVEKTRRSRLDERLGIALGLGRRNDLLPQWIYVDDRMRNWNRLVPELLKECEDGGGEITKYFVDSIIGVAVGAVPVVNEIEGESV